jgi:hypothetical protein
MTLTLLLLTGYQPLEAVLLTAVFYSGLVLILWWGE